MRVQELMSRFALVMLAASACVVAPSAVGQISLSAGPTTTVLPDGKTVPMWGYTCGTVTPPTGGPTCAALNPNAAGSWSPVLITVPTGQDLTINFTNNLSFTTSSGTNNIPTSLMVVGQLGGGLGSGGMSVPSPTHATQGTTWPTAGTGPTFTPPAQPNRVQSFATEVNPGSGGASLVWKGSWLKPGTYLIESGTHPSIQVPMGLYGILVVTTAPSQGTKGTAYPAANGNPAVTYDADVPFLMSEIDPVQNSSVATAVSTSGFSETAVWSGLSGGCGNPSSSNYNTCYPPAVNFTPTYYLVNGASFDKTNAGKSTLPVVAPAGTGNILVRFVNAGLRMHVPTIVGAQTGSANASGFSLIAEDGNPLPGAPRVQSEVFMAAGKTYDVMITAPATTTTNTAGAYALPVFDRELSLSTNNQRDGGMQAYIGINGGAAPTQPAVSAKANPDSYFVVGSNTLTVSDRSLGVLANDVGIYGATLITKPTQGSVALNTDGTFVYTPPSAGLSASDNFTYCGNGATSGPLCATATLAAATIEGASGITLGNMTFASNVATKLIISRPGVLAAAKDAAGYPLTVDTSTVVPVGGLTLKMNPDGSFAATTTGPGTYTFTYKAKNSQGTTSANSATVTLIFPNGNGPKVTVKDPKSGTLISDYRWLIEEDRTFHIDPNAITTSTTTPVPSLGTNFHTSFMPFVAQGCTGSQSCEGGQTLLGKPTDCEYDNGVCVTSAAQQTQSDPTQVHLDPNKHYYITVLPGDAANPFVAGNTGNSCINGSNTPGATSCGHTLGGAPLAPAQSAVTVLTEPTPLPTAKVSVVVFEDDNPLNGEQDAGGGVDILAPNEPGLGGFEIRLFDDAGGTGDPTGQITYDMFNLPLSNSLAGMVDPATGNDACPISAQATAGATQTGSNPQGGITGMVVTCPYYESDGKTASPLAGQAVIANLYPGRFGVVANPGADRIARGEQWLQTNTLDGQKGHDAFVKVGGPAYFQEYGPAGYHDVIGFANPAIINGRLKSVQAGAGAAHINNVITGNVTTIRLSRTPDERMYSSGSRKSFAFTQCYASLGDPDGADFEFSFCDENGNFKFTGVPDGTWRVTLFDQWNDQLVDGLSVPAAVSGGTTLNMGDVPVQQWQPNLYTRLFMDDNGDGVSQDNEAGLALVPVNVRFRDGSFSNRTNTDLNGYASYNEVFPLFNWYVVEADTTRYKQTGVHVVYDSGGPADGTKDCNTAGPCGTSQTYANMANTAETVHLPANLRFPGSVYCDSADCSGKSIKNGPASSAAVNSTSTGRIDPPWVFTEGWQEFPGQNMFLEFGKKPFAVGENGGINGHVVYSSTRPFDDPALLVQNTWEPLVPNVTVNLYKEGVGPDGTQTLTLVDTTTTTSWDDWAQGFRSDGVPNMNCPGQTSTDPFYFTLQNTPQYLNQYNALYNGGTLTALPGNSQFKCFDGMHNWNQLQPAPFDGYYQFPSVTARDPQTGKPTGTNCAICALPQNLDQAGGDQSDWYYGLPMLPNGKYVAEVVVPPGYELVKEEDKNILIGDNYIAPAVVEFAGFGYVFILPDQAAIAGDYNPNNAQNSTLSMGSPNSVIAWPCVGQSRVVPDYISLFPGSKEVAPFAGATRNLCDRKELLLADQTSASTDFFIFSSTHIAAHYTGVITDDYSSEFDPFAPSFGEKFAPPNMPVSLKDFNGNEVSRTYSDQWGAFDGLNYSTWEVNPPNPTGYAPTVMVTCMNDPGPVPDPNNPGGTIIDPLFNPGYSQFCYELPFMPGQTQYMDTPVVPTEAFSEGYNHVDCAYPDVTPAIKEVDGDIAGPWVATVGGTITSVTVVNAGKGYNTAPSVTFTGGGGTGAAATAQLNGYVNTISIGASGSGYPTNTTVNFTGGGGSGATATATVTSGRITALKITNGGSGYTSAPAISFSGTGGTGARATATLSHTVSGITVTNAGSGYTTAPTVTIASAPANGTTATATAAVGTGGVLTLTALGPQLVSNYGYSGPSATAAPFNEKTISRNYTFGPAKGTVTIGGLNATIVDWSANTIHVQVPAGLPLCARSYSAGMSSAQALAAFGQCGQLIVTAANGKSTIDAVTVTVGGKAPTIVTGENATNNAIQLAIDAATPGDLIMVQPGNTQGIGYFEMLLMWKPVRLQGVGAPSVILNANTHPSGKMDGWRRAVNCLFGLALNGQPIGTGNPYDPTDPNDTCDATKQFQVDRIPLEGIVGWDTNLNGNLAQLLQEPTLMGAYEGAGVTVLGKGVKTPPGVNPFGQGGALEGDFPAGTVVLTNSAADCKAYPSNFLCAPSRIDGLTIQDSSQGGGGIFVHGWNHYLEIANNRVINNSGTLSGGISVGQGEVPDPTLNALGVEEPYALEQYVSLHNNDISMNSSYGDELFSATPAAAGGITFSSGADYYKFTNNFVCGNMSTGDGGGINHLGFIYNGDIEHNTIIFNQSFNPTIPTNGGGIVVMGASPDGTVNGVECGNDPNDTDCPPGLSEGTGPGLVINANLIMGNSAESGTGGGIRLQSVNGTEVSQFPRVPLAWYGVTVTNNIIANNVAGWDGAGVSLQDALKVDFRNNTVISNDSTASSGVLFDTSGAPLASTPPPGCNPQTGTGCTNPVTTSTPQVAGLVTMGNTPNLIGSLPNTGITCPVGYGYSSTQSCAKLSLPILINNLFWQNRTFNIDVAGQGSGLLNQQNMVNLVPSLNQKFTGDCETTGINTVGPTAVAYWDIGIRGDTAPNNHAQNMKLSPSYSILTDASDYPGAHNVGANPAVVKQYCNGARVPPENGGLGYQTPPGIADSVVPNPVFNLTPAATVDEGNNWINMSWGPLSLVNPATNVTLGDYDITASSSAIKTANVLYTPPTDFYGNPRPASAPDIGAVEYVPPPSVSVSPTALEFDNVVVGTTSAGQTLTVSNTSGSTFTFTSIAITAPFARATPGGTCATTLLNNASCTINVVYTPTGVSSGAPGTVTITGSQSVLGSPVALIGSSVARLVSASFTPGNWAPSQVRNCPTPVMGCTFDPAQAFTLTNTGNVTLTGIAQAVLAGTSVGDYTVVRLLSTCGPAGNGQLIANTTLAPGASCIVTVQFKPRNADPMNTHTSATISVTDAAGTQTATLTGLAE